MEWFWLSMLTAVTQAVKDACLKRCVDRMDVGVAVVAYTAIAAAVFWVAAGITGCPRLEPGFWPALLAGGLIGAVAFWLYGVALRAGELSLTVPILAFTPFFLLVTSPLTVGEFPAWPGLVGILCVVIGSYVLNLQERTKGVWGPVRALWTNRGARLMLLVAALWSLDANIDKIGLRVSSPEFWIAAVYSASSAALLPGVLGRKRHFFGQMAKSPGLLLAAGVLEAGGLLCQMHALTLTLVPYVIAVKRVSVVFGVLLGAWLFHEPDLFYRLPGALVMVAGVFFIAVFG